MVSRRALALAFLLALPSALATHAAGKGPESLGGATVPHQADLVAIEAESFPQRDQGHLVSDATASGGAAWALDTFGGINATVTIPTTGVVWFRVYATGTHPDSFPNPHLHLYIDGIQRGEWDVRGGWGPYLQSIPLSAGTHAVRLAHIHRPPDRDGETGWAGGAVLTLDKLVLEQPTLEGSPLVAPGEPAVVPASQIHASLTGQLVADANATTGQAWWEWGMGCFLESFVADDAFGGNVSPRMRGNVVNGEGTHALVKLDGATLDDYEVGDAYATRATPIRIAAGAHILEICYDNDRAGEKRNLWLDEITIAADGPAPSWPAANDGPANDRAPDTTISRANAANATAVWSFRAAGAVTGTPAIANGTVYFGDGGGKVHALRLTDGRELWSVDHGAPIDSSLAVDGDRLLAADERGNLTALDRATGRELWRAQADPTNGTHLYGSPVPYGGRVYQGIASEQTLLEWTGPQDFRGGVAAFDEATGAMLWRFYTAPEGSVGVSVWSTPALDPNLGLLFVGSGNAYRAPAGSLSDATIALRMDDGSLAWAHQATANDTFNGRGSPGPDRDLGASPNLFDAGGRKLVGEGDKGGTYYALDRATGAVVWQTKVAFEEPGATPAQVEGFLGTAAARDGTIFAPTTARSMVHALDAATGKERWATELNPFPQSYGERMFGAATAADGVALQGTSTGRVFLLDARDGSVLANLSAGGSVEGGIAVAGDAFVVPDVGANLWSGAGGVTAYRVAGGEPVVIALPNATATGPTPASPVDTIVVTLAPSGDPGTGAGAAVNNRLPDLGALGLIAAGAAAAFATRSRPRR